MDVAPAPVKQQTGNSDTFQMPSGPPVLMLKARPDILPYARSNLTQSRDLAVAASEGRGAMVSPKARLPLTPQAPNYEVIGRSGGHTLHSLHRVEVWQG
ncbi:hypothetical protein [Cypionkella sp.]|uniref:hypothetical protein n=1 Tax=Cypionkella sp. TaxID=2811411 RepID=UPI0026026D99|nr:hypothetical protein [Cypionkella sp.]